MTDLVTRLLRLVGLDQSWREERRTMSHPVFGELQFEGRRTRRDGPVSGLWYVTYPQARLTHRFSVTFPSADPTPSREHLTQLQALLDDIDNLFERGRSVVAVEYEKWIGEPLPADWRSVFRLDSITLPDTEYPDEPWDIVYWCEGALHWFRVEFERDAVTYVSVDG
jgi:hypothetical protein